MRREALLLAQVTVLTCVAFSGRAEASGAPYPSCVGKTVAPSESTAAHTIYKAGKIVYDDGKYESAVQQFRESYARDCTKHDLLVVIAAAYERMGNRAEAIRALETYLERVPGSPDAAAYRVRIDDLKVALAAEPPPPPIPVATPVRVEPIAPAPEPRTHSALPWVVVGVGGAALVTGVVVLATAPSLPADCDKAAEVCARRPGESTADLEARQDTAGRAKGQPTAGLLIAIGGGVLAAGGLAWHWLEPTGPKKTGGPRVRPSMAPGYVGVTIGGVL